jgi:hypothetical protein
LFEELEMIIENIENDPNLKNPFPKLNKSSQIVKQKTKEEEYSEDEFEEDEELK